MKRFLWGALIWAVLLLEGPLGLSAYSVWFLSLPLQFGCAWQLHLGLWRGLRDLRVGVSMLASVSSWAMFFLSTAAVFFGRFLPEGLREHRLGSLAALVTLVSLGQWLETRFQKKTLETLRRLLRRIPRTARVLREGRSRNLPVSEVGLGEVVLVRSGEQIPLDGEVVEGEGLVEESLRTGSSGPCPRCPGSRVFGGTVVKEGELSVSVRKTGPGTELRRLIEEIRDGLSDKRPPPRAAETIARLFLTGVLLAAALAALAGATRAPEPRSVYVAAAFLSVLSSACPWVLSLAFPIAMAFGRLKAARMGIVIRNPRMIEAFRLPDAVVFGKQGILTQGRPEVREVLAFGPWDRTAALELMLAAEEGAEHAFAKSLRRHAPGARGQGRRRSFEAVPTRGIAAVIGKRRVLVGSLPWLALHGIEPPGEAALGLKGRTESLVGLAVDGRFAAVVALSDGMREGAKDCVARLQEGGLEPVLVSGDGNAAAYRAAEAAGVVKVYAEAGEEERLSVVEQLRSKGRRVAMLGGGIQDARALSRAEVAFAPAGAPFLIEEASDFVLEEGSLDSLRAALRLGMDIRAALRRNFIALFAVNAALIPVSAWAVYRGSALRPEYAAAAAVAGLAAVLASSSRIGNTLEAS